MHYLDRIQPAQIEIVGDDWRITFELNDQLALQQSVHSGGISGEFSNLADEPERISSRKVVLLLNSKYGYAVSEHEHWSVVGRRVAQFRSEDWKYYPTAELWLPSRCVATYYARPPLLLDDASDDPVHVVTHDLKRVVFGKQDIAFTFSPPEKPAQPVFESPLSAARTDPLDSMEKLDLPIVDRIKTRVLEDSRVMDVASWLSDVYGPRLTGSPNNSAATEWILSRLKTWGLSNVHAQTWGPFDRSWTQDYLMLRATSPSSFSINACAATWSSGTKQKISGRAIRFDVHSRSDTRRRFAGKLKGVFLLMQPPLPIQSRFEPMAVRLSEERLQEFAGPQPTSGPTDDLVEVRYLEGLLGDEVELRWLVDQGVAALLFPSPGDPGTIRLVGLGGTVSSRFPSNLPVLKVAPESYGRITRILEKGIDVTLEFELWTTFYHQPKVSNIIAEIPGSDRDLKEEVVLIGAHLDSWTFATGATDNAAGCAVMMEAMRILRALDLKPRRTIRLALWSGEEQGGLGSKAYVQQHFGEPDQLSARTSTAARNNYESFCVYFNLDGGSGKIRGIFNVEPPAVRKIFQAWLEPFKNLGLSTVSSWDVGAADQSSFARVGLPSFGFIQDPIDYGAAIHSSTDVYERIHERDLQFNAAVVASLAWHAAQRDEKLPRAVGMMSR